MRIMKLVKRNILVYTRDRANIFFSLLSVIIIIGLMVLFLGNMNIDNVVYMLQDFGERDSILDRENAKNLIMLWSIAGIVVVNSVTVTLAMVGIMVEDEARNRLASFFVAPVNRGLLAVGYMAAAVIVGIVMCVLTVIISDVILWAAGGSLLSVHQLTSILLYIIINVFTFSGLGLLLAAFIHTTSAFAGLSTIIGTLVGFLSAIYLPMGALPEKVQAVLKSLPMLHGSAMMREVFTREAIKTTFTNCPEEFIEGYKEYMGIALKWNDTTINNSISVAFLVISGIVFIGISAFILNNKNSMKR
ncbi:MAG: type transporter [Herbinix sp.]|jgi:multidrug/hemolysin transport system permease protein|nr:type transporter [Herbinix sp.]